MRNSQTLRSVPAFAAAHINTDSAIPIAALEVFKWSNRDTHVLQHLSVMQSALCRSAWPIYTEQLVHGISERCDSILNPERQPRKIRIKGANYDSGMRQCPTLMELQEVPAIV